MEELLPLERVIVVAEVFQGKGTSWTEIVSPGGSPEGSREMNNVMMLR